MRAVLAATLLVALTAGRGLVGAQQPHLTVKLAGFHADNWARAQAVVTVLDDKGEPVSGLTKPAFTSQVNGGDAQVVGLSSGIDSTLPLVVVLAIDVSSGMEGDKLAEAKLAAWQFLDGLGAQDSVAVIGFGDVPNTVQPFTLDRASARLAIESLTAAGGSALHSATTQSILLASAHADTGRRAVVLLSSGADTTSSSNEDALFAAKALGVPVFAIGLGSGIDSAFLRELANVSAGQFTESAEAPGLVQQYQNVSKLLRDQYVLTIDASGAGLGASTPATLRVDVNVDGRTGGDERLVCEQRVCVALTNITPDEVLTAQQTVTAQVVSSETVTSVTLLVDGNAVSKITQPPYVFTFTPNDFATGSHTLSAEVATSGAAMQSAPISVRLPAPATGSNTTLLIVAATAVAAFVTLSAFVFVRRRHRGAPDAPAPEPDAPPPDGPKPRERLRLIHSAPERATRPGEPEVVLGRLTVAEGPLAGQLFSVGPAPISIGSTPRCQIQFSESDKNQELGFEYARVWIRDDRLVLHELRRLTARGAVGGRWELLTTGDLFTIGPCSFLVEVAGANVESPPAAPASPIAKAQADAG